MAETVLVRTALTPEMIAMGRELLVRLDALDTGFEAAFWLFDEEIGEWRLVLASPRVRISGSRILYRKVNRALAKLGAATVLSLEMISITDQRDPIVQSLVHALGSASSVDGVRLDNATVDGMRIPGSLLYRLTRRQWTTAGPTRASLTGPRP